jgi:hypothetical protein
VGRLGGERGRAKQGEEDEAEFHGERIAGRSGGSDSAGTNTPQGLKPIECGRPNRSAESAAIRC